MYQMLKVIEEWKLKYHSDKSEIIFQNKKFLFNIIFSQNSLINISKNSKGFENIPNTVENPDEVWSELKDDILKSYIKFAKPYSYVVQTKNGIIENAFLTTSVDKYRKGLWLT